MSNQIDPPFSQGVGYGLILGVGAIFAIGMSTVSWGLSRFFAERQTSEMFMTAKHSVKTGLTASAVVSSWTIAATLLTSTTEGYLYGVSGPFWYAAGASVQILLFAVAAIELKRKAPNAHTFLEVVRTRYGAPGHIVLGCYSLFYQVIQTTNLLVGGSAAFATLTGMNRDAACFLFPVGVVIYSLAGGIKATFLTDWVHTVIIYIIMLTALFVVYATSSVVGSSDKMFDLLLEAHALHPVEGNQDGSYLTMRSVQGGYVGLIFVGAGFGAAVDSQLFQKAIAANPADTLGGYLIGGTSWFTIPFCLASTYGLTAAATEHLPAFPTYPNRMNDFEVSSGMAMPYAALAVMGKGGAIAILLMLFMAVTSACSSEIMATTALTTYDFYQAYIRPRATGKELIRFGHIQVPCFAIFVSCLSIGFGHAGFNVSFLITAIGIFVDSAIVPMACTIFWRKQSTLAVVLAPLLSSAAGLIAWFLVTQHEYGHISITTLSGNLPLVAGNMMSLCGPIVLTPLLTYIKPANYDWELLKTQIQKADDDDQGRPGLENPLGPSISQAPRTHHHHASAANSAPSPPPADLKTVSAEEAMTSSPNSDTESQHSDAMLLRARTKAIWASLIMTLCYLILWPIPMYGSRYVFSKGFFKGWIVVVFLWAFYAATAITLLPIWEGRRSIAAFFAFLFRPASSRTRRRLMGGGAEGAETATDGVVVVTEGVPKSGGGDGNSKRETNSSEKNTLAN